MNYRPHTTIILAMTADGKIADRKNAPARFGSQVDQAHLEEQIHLVDGVLFGANTLRAYGTSMSVRNPKLAQARSDRNLPTQPIQIVASASGKLDKNYKFFKQPFPRWLLTLPENNLGWQDSNLFERILIAEFLETKAQNNDQSDRFNWQSTLSKLKDLGINKLAVLGGSTLVSSLLAINAIDEIWLTVCPFIFGGKNSPTPVTGAGWLQSEAIALNLLEVKHIGQEVFLHYAVKKKALPTGDRRKQTT